jgi:hypothetical protein
MLLRFTLTFATLAFSSLSFGQIGLLSDVFQVHPMSSLNFGDSFLDITNTGANVTAIGQSVANAGGDPSLNICANLYTFDPAEELISCCTCTVTPGGLQSMSVKNSLISNPLTPAIPTSVVVKVVANTAATCNASAVTAGSLANGLVLWGTTLHQNSASSSPSYGLTESPFSHAVLSQPELDHITATCGFIQANGSGFGICKGCAAGGQGASTSIQ